MFFLRVDGNASLWFVHVGMILFVMVKPMMVFMLVIMIVNMMCMLVMMFVIMMSMLVVMFVMMMIGIATRLMMPVIAPVTGNKYKTSSNGSNRFKLMTKQMVTTNPSGSYYQKSTRQ
jgi:hypothetical protein